jgi:hypothetical protein
MPSQKRDELLTQLERDRLVSRNKKTVASNDARVQRKLSAWLKNVPDVRLILKNLPEDQKRATVNDTDIFALLDVVERLLAVKEFHSIYGEFRDPTNWGITEVCGDSRRYRCDPRSLSPAADIDILRSLFLSDHLEKLDGFMGSNNPVTQYALIEQLAADSRYSEHVTPEDRAGMDRIRRALKNVPNYTAQQLSPKKIDLNYMVDFEQPQK